LTFHIYCITSLHNS